MRTILILIFTLALQIAFAQIEKTVSIQPDYALPGQGVIHTIKVDVTNNYDKCKLLFLRNDPEVTGLDFSVSSINNPVQLLAEYGGSLHIDLATWMPSPFGVWFKNMEPKSTFTFYFQSHRDIDVDRLLDLVRISVNDFSYKTRAMDELGWKPDEIVICLPLSVKPCDSVNHNEVENQRKSIYYEFGESYVHSVNIVEGDSLCDVYISYGDKIKHTSTTCEKVPILKWAFDNLANELKSLQFETVNGYQPINFMLSLIEDENMTLVDSSSIHVIDGKDDLTEGIEELKRFIISLWSLEYQSLDDVLLKR